MPDPVRRLREICLALPGVTERLSHGEASFFAANTKQFVTVDDHHHGADRVAFWCAAAPGEQEARTAEDPRRYFRPPYVGHRGWLGVRIDTDPDWRQVAEIVQHAYDQVAQKGRRPGGAAAPGQPVTPQSPPRDNSPAM